jgi:hypothetical protein
VVHLPDKHSVLAASTALAGHGQVLVPLVSYVCSSLQPLLQLVNEVDVVKNLRADVSELQEVPADNGAPHGLTAVLLPSSRDYTLMQCSWA